MACVKNLTYILFISILFPKTILATDVVKEKFNHDNFILSSFSSFSPNQSLSLLESQ